MDEMGAKLPGGKIKTYHDAQLKRLCIFCSKYVASIEGEKGPYPFFHWIKALKGV